jgi:hypothetical protein
VKLSQPSLTSLLLDYILTQAPADIYRGLFENLSRFVLVVDVVFLRILLPFVVICPRFVCVVTVLRDRRLSIFTTPDSHSPRGRGKSTTDSIAVADSLRSFRKIKLPSAPSRFLFCSQAFRLVLVLFYRKLFSRSEGSKPPIRTTSLSRE